MRAAWALALGVGLGYPMLRLFVRSFSSPESSFTFEHYVRLVTHPGLIEATLNSLWIGAGTVIGSTLIAAPFAYLTSRTDLPFRGFFRGAVILTFAAPSFIAALGWILLLGSNGIINVGLKQLFGLDSSPISIFNAWGIIFVLSTFLYPLVFLPLSSAFEQMDVALEQAASSLGASKRRVFFRITLPLVAPGFLGGGLLVFVTAFVIFGPVAVLGAPVGFRTIPTVLLDLMSAPPRTEAAAVIGVPVLAVIACAFLLRRWLLGARRFTTVTGKATPRTPIKLGWRKVPALALCFGIFTVTLVLPFGILALTSFRRAIGRPLSATNLVFADNYLSVLNNPQIVAAFRNSLALAVTGTLAAVLLALLAVWLLHRTRSRWNRILAPVMLAPLAFPGAVLAIGLIIAFGGPPWFLTGTLTVLFIGYTLHSLPLAFTYLDAAMSQVAPELEEAARTLSARWWRTWRLITLPLLRSSIVAVSLLTSVLLFRELEMSVFLYTGANPTVATVLYELASESQYQLVGALSVLVLSVNIVVVLGAMRLLRGAALLPAK